MNQDPFKEYRHESEPGKKERYHAWRQRYDGTFSGTLADGAGVTAQLLMDNGFRCLDVEDLFEIHEGTRLQTGFSCCTESQLRGMDVQECRL